MPPEAKLRDQAVTLKNEELDLSEQKSCSQVLANYTQNNRAMNSVGGFQMIKTELKGRHIHLSKCQVWKKALSGKGADCAVQYSQARSITMIGFTLRNIWLSKQNQGALEPEVYANEFWCMKWGSLIE